MFDPRVKNGVVIFVPLSVRRLPQAFPGNFLIWILESAKEQLGPRLRKAGFHSMNGIFFGPLIWCSCSFMTHILHQKLDPNTNLSSFRCMRYMYIYIIYMLYIYCTLIWILCIIVYIWNYMFNIPYIKYHPSESYRNPIAFAASAPRATWFWRSLFSINYKVQVYVRPFGRGWVETPKAVPSYDGFLVSGSTFGRKMFVVWTFFESNKIGLQKGEDWGICAKWWIPVFVWS